MRNSEAKTFTARLLDHIVIYFIFTFDRVVKRTKKHIGFEYGNLIRRIVVSFVCENAVGAWGHQMCSFVCLFFFFPTPHALCCLEKGGYFHLT
jgi:hypothetical protein